MLNAVKKLNVMAMLLFIACLVCGSHQAAAQQSSQSWNFKTENRAAIAALMQQVENKDSAGTAVASGGYTNLVCGDGSGSSSSEGNSTCIILNNATGSIETGQNSEGNQSATNTAPTDESVLSEVLEAIQ